VWAGGGVESEWGGVQRWLSVRGGGGGVCMGEDVRM
jgi:hypothetical protein